MPFPPQMQNVFIVCSLLFQCLLKHTLVSLQDTQLWHKSAKHSLSGLFIYQLCFGDNGIKKSDQARLKSTKLTYIAEMTEKLHYLEKHRC
jgi:hypothetical protein